MKILYTATVLSHICQFHLPHLKMLQESGHEVHVAAHDNLAVKNGLKLQYTDQFHEIPFQRSPLEMDNIKAYFQLKKLIDQEKFDFIVCNTPMGGIITRLAARQARKHGTKVFYMAHGFHFYQGAPKKNWLIYYPIERLFAHLTDVLITIVAEDYKLAQTKFATQVEHIHGVGVSPDRYHPVDAATSAAMRQSLGLKDSDFVLLCVGELNRNKNQTTLISAAAQLKAQIPQLKILFAGNGPLEMDLKKQVNELYLTDVVKFLGYRTDLETITPCVDIVVSCSQREGLPLNIIEAMLCAKPVVASNNRGHRELIENGVNGQIVSVFDIEQYVKTIKSLYNDASQRETMGQQGLEIAYNYTSPQTKKELNKILIGNNNHE